MTVRLHPVTNTLTVNGEVRKLFPQMASILWALMCAPIVSEADLAEYYYGNCIRPNDVHGVIVSSLYHLRRALVGSAGMSSPGTAKATAWCAMACDQCRTEIAAKLRDAVALAMAAHNALPEKLRAEGEPVMTMSGLLGLADEIEGARSGDVEAL